ncbi:MAG: PKD domain-containing protein, partial [Nitrospiraceae bacterium]|nr:PKD domain-containing protein [Nitrospiraceae bacterium]
KRTSMSKILFLFMIAASLPTFSTFSFADTANIYYDDVNRVVREEYGQNIPTTFTIAATAGTNGTISPAGTTTVNKGASQTFSASPTTPGYHVADVLADGVSVLSRCTWVGSTASYTFTNITTDHEISATFTNTYKVTPSAGDYGGINPNTVQTVAYNSTPSFTVSPNTGYHAAIGGTCGGTLTGNTYTTNPITADCTVAATFDINQYSVSAGISGGNGTLDVTTPSPQTVNYNSTTSFKFNANAGYHVSNVTGCFRADYSNSDNGVSSYTYTTGPVIDNCTVTASFARNRYQVTASAGPNGSLDASTPSPQTISYNGTTSFTFDSNTDYHIGSIEGCWGTPYTNTSPAVTSYPYSTGPITADCMVMATFVINPPVASFVILGSKPSSGKVPLQVSFQDTSTPAASSWHWDFGDGTYSTEQNPVHVFETYGSGSYSVKLTAINDGGSSGSAPQSVIVLACDNPQSVKLSSSITQYTSISTALGDAAGGDTIQSQAIHFTESVSVDKDIIFDGGYDCDIAEKVGNTTIKGATAPSLSIDTGSATMDGISVE